MDWLAYMVPTIARVIREMPAFIADVKRLADALRSHPDPTVRGGADHLEEAIVIAERDKPTE